MSGTVIPLDIDERKMREAALQASSLLKSLANDQRLLILCKLVGEDKNSWYVALESVKALLTIITYDEKPAQDAVVAERQRALSAIGTTLINQDAKFLQARIRNAVLANSGYCPIGAEAEPLVEWCEQTLREWAKTEKGHFGPPLPRLCQLLAAGGFNIDVRTVTIGRRIT